MKRLMVIVPVLALALAAFVPGTQAQDPTDPSDCGAVWVSVASGGPPALNSQCEATLADATTLSGDVEVLVGTTLGSSMSGRVTLEIEDQDGNLLASCSDEKVGVAFSDWANGDRPGCSTGDVDITGLGVTDVTCTVTDANRGAGTFECTLS